MHRRQVIAALPATVAAAALAPGRAAAESTAMREFRVFRDGTDIGRHRLTARSGPEGFALDIDIDLVVRVIGIAAYRYEMTVAERWKGGRLDSLESETNDDGDDAFARMRREGDEIVIEGSGYSGRQPADAAATTYFTRPLLQRRPWLSSQSGQPVTIDPKPVAGEEGAFDMRGELGNVLIWDENGDWVGCRFDAGGEPARYELDSVSGSIADLWRSMA